MNDSSHKSSSDSFILWALHRLLFKFLSALPESRYDAKLRVGTGSMPEYICLHVARKCITSTSFKCSTILSINSEHGWWVVWEKKTKHRYTKCGLVLHRFSSTRWRCSL